MCSHPLRPGFVECNFVGLRECIGVHLFILVINTKCILCTKLQCLRLSDTSEVHSVYKLVIFYAKEYFI
jgi:hypothetical protein